MLPGEGGGGGGGGGEGRIGRLALDMGSGKQLTRREAQSWL